MGHPQLWDTCSSASSSSFWGRPIHGQEGHHKFINYLHWLFHFILSQSNLKCCLSFSLPCDNRSISAILWQHQCVQENMRSSTLLLLGFFPVFFLLYSSTKACDAKISRWKETWKEQGWDSGQFCFLLWVFWGSVDWVYSNSYWI